MKNLKLLMLCVAWFIVAILGFILLRSLLRPQIYLVSSSYIAAYLVLPLLSFLALLHYLANKSTRVLVSSYSIFILLGLLALEALLSIHSSRTSKSDDRARILASWTRKAGRPLDSRSLKQVILASNRNNPNPTYFPTISPSSFLLDPSFLDLVRTGRPALPRYFFPLTNISYVKSVYCNESGRWMIFNTDAYGFNNNNRMWAKNVAKDILLGDSFAQGACIYDNKNASYFYNVEIRPDGPYLLNLGMGGTGPLVQLAILKEFGRLIKPRKIYWLFYQGNDFSINIPMESKSLALRQYLKPSHSQRITEFQSNYSQKMKNLLAHRFEKIDSSASAKNKTSIVSIISLHHLRNLAGLTSCPIKDKEAIDHLRTIYRSAHVFSKSINSHISIVYLPSIGSKCTIIDANSHSTWLRNTVRQAALDAGLNFYDFTEFARIHGRLSEIFYYPGSHYNHTGYKLLAEYLSTF